MALTDRKIIIWCGNAPNQKALANKIADRFNLAGIVIDEGTQSKAKRKWSAIPSFIIDRLRFKKVYDIWSNLMRFYSGKYPEWPSVPLLRVNGINDPATKEFTNTHKADLVVVSGTALVKGDLLTLPLSIGIINLHTGLSPFVKGGPNCTNWCIANNEWHLVGNTIMWLNAGIDSGNIITSEAIDVRNASSLDEAHQQVMNHAHDLYLRAIAYLLSAQPPFISIAQKSLGKGNLYLTKMWTAEKRKALLKNWGDRQSVSANYQPVQTVSLPHPSQNEQESSFHIL